MVARCFRGSRSCPSDMNCDGKDCKMGRVQNAQLSFPGLLCMYHLHFHFMSIDYSLRILLFSLFLLGRGFAADDHYSRCKNTTLRVEGDSRVSFGAAKTSTEAKLPACFGSAPVLDRATSSA